jgi:hypothetical protein
MTLFRRVLLYSQCLLIALAAGCHQGAALPPATGNAPLGKLHGGDKVTLIREAHDYALVEKADGSQAYVASGLLKHRNTAAPVQGALFTHTVVRETPVYAEAPARPEPLAPRAMAQIDLEQATLNGLYLSERTGKQVIAPRNVARFLIDEETGERCWHAYECTHPECQGERRPGFDHYVFIYTDVEKLGIIDCPACAMRRQREKESAAERQRWGEFVRPYELPETLRRRAELDAERREAIQAKRRSSGVTITQPPGGPGGGPAALCFSDSDFA